MMRDQDIYWLALKRLRGVGLTTQHALLDKFGSAAAVFDASTQVLRTILGEQRDALSQIAAGVQSIVPQDELTWLEHEQHHLVTLADLDYPSLLREIPDAPVALFVSGDRSILGRPQLAIVGSRNPTPVGRETALAFAQALARAGCVITSGLARGIDGAAHEAGLDAGAPTVAVAGTGLDRVYPATHRALAHRIVQQGALVSEFPLGTPPLPGNFPIRNRLISGLSLGVLVVEAAARSGSLITARLATEQGREVFAIPGSIHSPLSRGCHRLIRQGAKLVETAQDIIEELGPLLQFAQAPNVPVSEAKASLASDAELSPAQRQILDQIGFEATAIDTLVERSGLTADVVSSMLLELELKGMVMPCGGGRYMRRGGDSIRQTGN